MNYVGKFFSNFKGFYNDINSATLTGAIDILVVRQEDGTYATSPWHVRFGKMGVIRAREKLVDIEVNGKPVKLCMKLGEAGEAFFVQEAENRLQVPSHLSTSPIDSGTDYCGINYQLDQDVVAGSSIVADNDAHRHCIDINSDYMDELCDKHCDTVITIDGDNIIVTEVPKSLAPEQSITASVTMDNNHYFASHTNLFPLSSGCRPRRTTTATQTEMSGDDVEAKKCKSRNVSGETAIGSRSQSPFPERILTPLTSHVDPVVEMTDSEVLILRNVDVLDDGVGLRVPGEAQPSGATQTAAVDSSAIGTEESGMDSDSDVREKCIELDETVFVTPSTDVSQLNAFFVGERNGAQQLEEIFELELSDDEAIERRKSRNVVVQTKDPLPAELCDDLEQEWNQSQLARNFHPFSDTDITPGTSPIGSRPPSPKSDSEYETQKYDATCQTQLTGDELMLLDDIKWVWGEFPQPSPTPAKTPSASSDGSSKKEDKPSGGLFQFMRKTKKIRHQPQEGGIYLEDLNLTDMDPEVAALYLYSAKSHLSASDSKDEDSESGQGLSLPQSPVTFDQESPTTPLVATDDTDISSGVVLSDMALSLCGGLQDIERGVPAEQFTKYLVSYENFCDNPNLLADPNLVVRLNGKFYCWPVAGPMVMSILVFNKPLDEQSCDSLIKQHLPKKERRRGLWWWSRGTQVIATTSESTRSPQAISGTASVKDLSSDVPLKVKSKPRKARGREGSTSGDDSDTVIQVDGKAAGPVKIHAREKYIKSLKLTNDQIASLNLKDGANDVTFSVTTQYQGTSRCHCYLYLWNWDDRIIVSDIDGTITRSDVWGQVLPMIGKDWSQVGIANLYSMIERNGYKFLYLSARAIGQSKITRDYLHSVRQGDLCLPDGPLLLSPSSLLSAFYKEVIERKPEEFKIGCLRDISVLFPPARNPFYAGFGNKVNDTYAYRAVGIPISRVFTVNPKGELSMGLSFQSSYTKLTDIVDHFFPPLLHCNCHHEVVEAGKFPGATEYSDFTYWREPLPDIQDDLTRVASSKTDKTTGRKNQETGREKLRQSKKWRKK